MKRFSTTSWHYRLASLYGPLPRYSSYHGNICEYLRAVLLGFVATCLIIGGISLISSPLALTAAWIVVWAQTGIWVESMGPAILLGALIGAVLIGITLGVFYGGTVAKHKIRGSLQAMSPDSFLKSAWHSIHNKICFVVVAK